LPDDTFSTDVASLRFDEARARSLDADRGRFSSLERHKQNPALAGFQGDPAEIVPALEP
jgi:hypothetical protein